MQSLVILSIALALCTVSLAQDKSATVDDYSVKVQKTSGKITVTKNEGNDTSKATTVVIELDKLEEVDKDGGAIKGGQIKHSFQSFASQDFILTDAMDAKIPDTTIDSKKIAMEGTLAGLSSKLNLDIYIAKADGKITLDGEESDIKKGGVKFNINLQDWAFCKKGDKGCTVDGAFVDITMKIKTPKGGEPKKSGGDAKKAAKVDLGDGADMQLSAKVKLDGNWTTMPTGYPKVATQGGSNLMTFRFAKFDTSAFYDPIVTVDTDSPASGVATITGSLVAIFVSALFALLY